MNTFIKTIFSTVLICTFSLIVKTEGNVSLRPAPPAVESDIGYLTVIKDSNIPPDIKKVFILPQSTLTIFKDNPESLELIADKKDFSYLCRIPKFARYTTLMIVSDAKDSIYFRGAVEAETIPFKIIAHEELPIVKKTEKGFVALLNRVDRNVPIFIPANSENLVFSEKSAFAKFADEQRKKGLVYFKNEWTPIKKMEEKKKLEKQEEEKVLKKWQDMNAAAENGFAVLADGTVLKGEKKGSDKTHILFVTKNREYRLGINNTADMTFDEIMASGWLDTALNYFNKASEVKAEDYGNALWFAEKALEYTRKIDGRTPKHLEKTEDLISQINLLMENANRYFSANNLTVYHYTVFPVNVLKYHLEKEHVLLQKKFWVKADQICLACDGSGKVICPTCEGTGKTRKKCEKCRDGKVTCAICNGSGSKDCDVCKGSGFLYKVCRTCKGKGSVTNYVSCGPIYPYYNSIYVGGKSSIIMYSGFSPCWFPWGCTSVEKCPVCDGSGRVKEDCFNCGGKGTVSCPKTQNCQVCKGLGYTVVTCDTCKGGKRIPCPKCEGKGFKGEIQNYPDAVSPEPSNFSPSIHGSSTAVP